MTRPIDTSWYTPRVYATATAAPRERRSCRDCGERLDADNRTGWCYPCGSWEFRHDRDDEYEQEDDE